MFSLGLLFLGKEILGGVFVKEKKTRREKLWICGIIFMAGMLLVTMFLICGSILAPYLRDSCVVHTWNKLLNSSLVMKIQNSNLYHVLLTFAHDAEGTLEPLQKLLELMGVVSVFFSAINEQLSSRKYGILLQDVIENAYPYHFIIQLPVHALFAVNGIYACSKKIGFAAIICFIGVLFCFCYSLSLFWCLQFSERKMSRLIRKYIDEKTLNNQKGSSEDDTHIHLFSLDYAQYLGKQWDSGISAQVHREEKTFTDDYLLVLVERKMALHIDLQDCQKNDEQKSTIRHGMLTYFPKAVEHSGKESNFILFVEGLYLYDHMGCTDLHIHRFQDDVLYCSQIWDVLLGQVEEKSHHAAMVHSILSKAHEKNNIVFTALSIGLLHFLRFSKHHVLLEEAKEIESSSIDFLFEVLKVHTTSGDNKPSFIHAWCEVILVACGMIQWMVTLGELPGDMENWLEEDILFYVRRHCLTDIDEKRLANMADFYTVLAYLLLVFENRDIHNKLPVHAIMSLYPSVRRVLTMK